MADICHVLFRSQLHREGGLRGGTEQAARDGQGAEPEARPEDERSVRPLLVDQMTNHVTLHRLPEEGPIELGEGGLKCRKVHRLLGAFLSPLAVYDAFHCSIDMQCTMLSVCFPCCVLSYLQSIHEFCVPMLRRAAMHDECNIRVTRLHVDALRRDRVPQ